MAVMYNGFNVSAMGAVRRIIQLQAIITSKQLSAAVLIEK